MDTTYSIQKYNTGVQACNGQLKFLLISAPSLRSMERTVLIGTPADEDKLKYWSFFFSLHTVCYQYEVHINKQSRFTGVLERLKIP